MGPTNLPLRLRRVLLSGVLGLVLLIPASVVPGPGSAASCAAAAAMHRVAVVVEHGDGTTLQRCVTFTTATISGADAVGRSGLQWGTVDYGGNLGLAVCQIDGEPATYPPNCFKSSDPFWALFVARAAGSWQASNLGVSNISLHDGDAVGFHYQSQATREPPSIAGNCPAPTAPPATPKPTPRPTLTPTTAPTQTPVHPSPSAPPGPAGSSQSATAGSAPAPSPSDEGGVALATDSPDGSPTPADAAGTALASKTPDPALAATAGTTGGGPPIGLVLAGVVALAFAALGAFQLRRPPVDLRRPR